MSVNKRLTRKRERETHEYAAMMRRMIAAHGRRVADADPEDLTDLIALRETLETAIGEAIRAQRSSFGTSWSDIGRSLGITKQAAQQRYGKTPRTSQGRPDG